MNCLIDNAIHICGNSTTVDTSHTSLKPQEKYLQSGSFEDSVLAGVVVPLVAVAVAAVIVAVVVVLVAAAAAPIASSVVDALVSELAPMDLSCYGEHWIRYWPRY